MYCKLDNTSNKISYRISNNKSFSEYQERGYYFYTTSDQANKTYHYVIAMEESGGGCSVNIRDVEIDEKNNVKHLMNLQINKKRGVV